MDKNKNSEENLKSASYFMKDRENRLFDEIKDEAEFFGVKEEHARKECADDIKLLSEETKKERERLNEIRGLTLNVKSLAEEKKLNSKALFSGVSPNPECVSIIEKLTNLSKDASTHEVKKSIESLCEYTSTAIKKKVDQQTLEEIIKLSDNLVAICERNSIEKELEHKITQREAERDQRLKQISDNIKGTIERSVELYIGNLKLELLGEKYAYGEPPRVRSTK
ncbi:MAG: hypothetical protein IJ400_05285 [Clostridia bacterium]|nr:hypothetical protein [Clostridia bacterium]